MFSLHVLRALKNREKQLSAKVLQRDSSLSSFLANIYLFQLYCLRPRSERASLTGLLHRRNPPDQNQVLLHRLILLHFCPKRKKKKIGFTDSPGSLFHTHAKQSSNGSTLYLLRFIKAPLFNNLTFCSKQDYHLLWSSFTLSLSLPPPFFSCPSARFQGRPT